MPSQKFDPEPRVLVIRAGALGDCLLMLPALTALRAHFAEGRIEVLGYPRRWEWVLGRGLVEAVHPIERPGMHLLFSDGAALPESLKVFLGGYDVILSYRPDPDGVFATNLRALGGPLVLSQPPFPPPPPPKIHVADFALRLVAQLGAPPAPAVPRLRLTADELALTRSFFSAHHVDPATQQIVVVHPGSGSEAKRWAIERFAAVIETLAAQPRVRIVIVAGYAEAGLVAGLLSLIHQAKPLVADNWPLLPTAALLGQATVFIGNDSGLSHLAAALGRPTVAIFGPTDPQIWGPRGAHVSIVRMLRESAVGDGQASGSDVRQVVDAAQHWLTTAESRRNPGGHSARS